MDTPPTSAPANATADRDDRLRRLPPEVQEAYHRFQASRDVRDLDPVIYAILLDFIPRKPTQPLSEQPGTVRLMDDLGFDSLAITEIVFFTEELFSISISNEEILSVRTLDDLRQFIYRKVATPPPAA